MFGRKKIAALTRLCELQQETIRRLRGERPPAAVHEQIERRVKAVEQRDMIRAALLGLEPSADTLESVADEVESHRAILGDMGETLKSLVRRVKAIEAAKGVRS